MDTQRCEMIGGPCDGARVDVPDGNVVLTKRAPGGHVAAYALQQDGSYRFDGYWPAWFGEARGVLDAEDSHG